MVFVLTFPNRYRLDELGESDNTHTHAHMESCHGIFKKICISTIFINCWLKVEVFFSMVYLIKKKRNLQKKNILANRIERNISYDMIT